MFILHDQLAKDCIVVGDFSLCKLLLMNDSQYPWLILVPMKVGLTETFQLSEPEQYQLLKENNAISKTLNELFSPDKLNHGAIGNLVPQLHIHCVARFKTDIAWPKPVWGAEKPRPYSEKNLLERLELLRNALASHGLK